MNIYEQNSKQSNNVSHLNDEIGSWISNEGVYKENPFLPLTFLASLSLFFDFLPTELGALEPLASASAAPMATARDVVPSSEEFPDE